MLGETVWVTVYVGLDYIFMDQVSTVAEIMGDVFGLLVSLVVVVTMALWLRGVLKARDRIQSKADDVGSTRPAF